MAVKSSVQKALSFLKSNQIKFVDLKFIDLPGTWQHYTVPVSEVSEESFKSGFGFDGSSIRGWKSINESDMLIVPDSDSIFLDPFIKEPTASFICDIYDPVTGEQYSRCPRNIARKAENYLRSTKLADVAYFGPEPEFFIFDDIQFETNANSSFFFLDSKEAYWNTGREEAPNQGYKTKFKGGYFPVPPQDSLTDIRNEMLTNLINMGIAVEAQHHEVATAGQAEIDMRYQPLLKMADQMMKLKYVVKNTAQINGKTATFMPKPIGVDNGSGMHVHISLWKRNRPTFAGKEYAGLSKLALYFIGGILKHAPSLLAFTNPTINSYRRLIPGFEAPVNLVYSKRNRSAAIRIPMYSPNPKSKRLEFRCPDATSNPYLAFAAILLAGLDGVENKIEPGEPLDKNIYNLSSKELSKIPSTPGSLDETLRALEKDHKYLLKGGVFTEDFITTWIDYKTKEEILPMATKPHPFEFDLYYDA